jgi:hypothetical protein
MSGFGPERPENAGMLNGQMLEHQNTHNNSTHHYA